MAATTMTDDNWRQIVEEREAVLVNFSSPNCGPCRAAEPALEQLELDMGNRLTVAKMNVNDHPGLAGKLGVMGTPTFVLFRGGEPVAKAVGFRSKGALIGTVRGWLDGKEG